MTSKELGTEQDADINELPMDEPVGLRPADASGVARDAHGNRYAVSLIGNIEHNAAVDGLIDSLGKTGIGGSPGAQGEAPEISDTEAESQAEYPSKPE